MVSVGRLRAYDYTFSIPKSVSERAGASPTRARRP